jgi:hypothetical protein
MLVFSFAIWLSNSVLFTIPLNLKLSRRGRVATKQIDLKTCQIASNHKLDQIRRILYSAKKYKMVDNRFFLFLIF